MQIKITKIKTGEYALGIVLNTPFGMNEDYTIHHKILTEKEFEWFRDCIINSSDSEKENYNVCLNGVDVKEIENGWLIEEKYNQLALMICKSRTIDNS